MRAKKKKTIKLHPVAGTLLAVGMFVAFSTLWSFVGPFLTWAFGFETHDIWSKELAYSFIYFGPMLLAIAAAWYLGRAISGKASGVAAALICLTIFIPFVIVVFVVIDHA